MRFHVGFSFRPSLSWIKWIGLAIIGLLAFFGIGNHVVLALQVEADASGIYARFPQNAENGYSAGEVLNFSSSTPLNVSWSSNRYSAFNITSNPVALGDWLTLNPNGRIRWTYASGVFNKCTSEQSATITFEFYLRKFTNSYMPNNWATKDLFSKVWVSTSSVGYDCQIVSQNGIKMTVSCTSKNPTSTYYIALENFNAPAPNGLISDSVINIGVRPLEITCAGMDSGAIITNNNTNTQNIITNNNNNTQQIIDSQTEINDNLTNDLVDGALETGNDFFDNFSVNSTTGFRGIITAPVRMFQKMINNDSCVPLTLHLNMSDDSHGGSNNLTLPCGNILWDKAPEPVIGIWYTLIGGVLAYRVLSDLVRFINGLLNPEDSKEFIMDL